MKLSVIIPAYNEEKEIGDCLRACLADAPPNLLEIIVVDNASTDRTAEIVREFPAPVRLVHEPRKGLPSARQCGFLASKGDVFISIDADTRVRPGWFTAIQEELSQPGVVCVTGPYNFYDLPAWKRMCVAAYWETSAAITRMFTHYMVVGGNFAAWKSALIKAGGFDPTISFYGEDTDIARRLHKIGKVLYRHRCMIDTSGRRLDAEGMIKVPIVYALNFLWIAAFHKPLTKTHVDVR